MSSIMKGIIREKSRVNNEPLDEISGETLGRYLIKSRSQRDQDRRKVINKTATPDEQKRLKKREQGASNAINKLLGMSKVPAKQPDNILYSARQAAIFKNLGDGYYLGNDSYKDDDGFTKEGYSVYYKEGEDQYRTVSSVSMSPYDNPPGHVENEIKKIIQKDKNRLKENKRIIGHDATDPDIAVKGGAGSYKLSTLKKKALGEIKAILADIQAGNFKKSAYNVNQLKNTLETIAEAEEEMEKSYFNEGVERTPHWDYLGFDVRSDILWPEKIFENIQQGPEFNAWFNQYKESIPKFKKNQNCILAMVVYTGDTIFIKYGNAVYVTEDDDYYILRNKTGIHEYSKKNQIIFPDLKALEKFKVSLKLKFDIEIKDDREEVKESRGTCWKGYEQIGMKEKNGKKVPNCVPKKKEALFR